MNTWANLTELVPNFTIKLCFAVMEHLLNHNYSAKHINFSIVYKCNNSIGTCITESLLISKLKLFLNN